MSDMAIYHQLSHCDIIPTNNTGKSRLTRSFVKFLFGFVVGVVCIWAYLKILEYVHQRGGSLGRLDASQEPPKVEIQSIFHGNTKDQDQI
jgi:hypothetical protein